MRGFRCALLLLVVFGLVAAVPASSGEKLKKEVAAIGDKLAEAMVANDFDTMLAMYLPDAISLPNYGPRMDGLDAFREHHAQMSASGMKIIAFASEPTDVWKAGDQVIEIGTYQIELEMPGVPVPIEDHGKYMTVYVRQKDGSLKIKAETWNTDVNPMEMAGMHGEHGHGGS